MAYLKRLIGEIKVRPLQYVIIFLIVFSGAVFFFQSSDATYPKHGDIYTDAAAIISARNLVQYGVVNLRYALLLSNPPANQSNQSLLYAHHPTFAVLILALFYYLGFSTIQARVFPLLISALGLLPAYLLGKKMFDESWGWAVMLIIAAAAPFRLLADSFYIEPYVFAVRAWAFFVVVSASSATLNKRRYWLIALGFLGFSVMNLAGWESLLSVCIFTILFPVFMIKEQLSYKRSLIKDLVIALGLGLLFGSLALVVHRGWVYGGFAQAFQDLNTSLQYRASGSLSNFINYVVYVSVRLIRFYPINTLVIFLFLPIILRTLKLRIGYRLDNQIIKFILILLVSESAWYILLRQHTAEHDHTTNLLLLTVGFGTALGIKLAYTLAKAQKRPNWFFAIPVVAIWLISFFNFWILSFDGNLQVNSTILEYSQQQIDFLTSRLNKSDVLVLDTTRYYYMYQSYALFQAHQLFIEPQQLDLFPKSQKLLLADPFQEKYNEYVGKYSLVAVVPPIALFDPSLPPGSLNQIYGHNTDRLVKVSDRVPSLFAFALDPSGPNTPKELEFFLLPDAPRILSFMLAQHRGLIEKGLSDSVKVDFILLDNKLEHLLRTITIGHQDNAWVPVEITLPALSQNATLKISITCSQNYDCAGDELFLAPVFEQ